MCSEHFTTHIRSTREQSTLKGGHWYIYAKSRDEHNIGVVQILSCIYYICIQIQSSAKRLFLGCMTCPRAQKRVTQPRKCLLTELCTLILTGFFGQEEVDLGEPEQLQQWQEESNVFHTSTVALLFNCIFFIISRVFQGCITQYNTIGHCIVVVINPYSFP